MTADELAVLVSLGLASDEQREMLAALTVEICRQAALCAMRRLPEISGDADDAAMIAAEKAIGSACSWKLDKGCWKTFVSNMCRHEVANCWRAYQRR